MPYRTPGRAGPPMYCLPGHAGGIQEFAGAPLTKGIRRTRLSELHHARVAYVSGALHDYMIPTIRFWETELRSQSVGFQLGFP